MADWYYYDTDFQKQGPYSAEQIRQFVKQETIGPDTLIVTPEGNSRLAKEIKGFVSSETLQPESLWSDPVPFDSPHQSSTDGDFSVPRNPTAIPPLPPTMVAANPFVASLPFPTTITPIPVEGGAVAPDSVDFPVFAQGDRGPIRKIFGWMLSIPGCLVILPVIAVAGLLWSEYRGIDHVSRKLIIEEIDITTMPLEIIDVSIDWAHKPNLVDVAKSFWRNLFAPDDTIILSAMGKATVKAKITEKLYKPIDPATGLQKMGFTDLYDDKFNSAQEKWRLLPYANRNDLQPPAFEDPLHFHFYSPVMTQGEEVELTASIELSKNSKHWNQESILWDKDRIQVALLFDGDVIPDSKMPDVRDARKIDDSATKRAVNNVVRDKKDFIDRVDTLHGDWKFNEAWDEAIRKNISDRPLQNIDCSVRWTNKSTDSASGTFTVKAKTAEKFYQAVDQAVDKKAILEQWDILKPYDGITEELGIKKIFETEVYEGKLLDIFEFYKVHFQIDHDVVLKGDIKMSKTTQGSWQGNEIQINSVSPALDDFARDSQLHVLYKTDNPRMRAEVEKTVREFAEWAEAMVTKKDNFDRFCKGKKYKGTLKFASETGNVFIEFEVPANSKTNVVHGTIDIPSPGWKEKRNFTVMVDTEKSTTDSVTGQIDNKGSQWPGWVQYLENAKVAIAGSIDREDAAWRLYDFLTQNTFIVINFSDNKMDFFITNNASNRNRELHRIFIPDDENVPARTPLYKDRKWIENAIKKSTCLQPPQNF